MNLKPLTSSWRTTTAGVLAALVALSTVIQAYLDNDPATTPQWEVAIGAIIAGVGLLFARDAKVSSEASGIK